MAGRIRKALQTYSCLLLCCTSLLHAAPADLAEAVLEVGLSADPASEMMVVLRGPNGEIYLEEGDFRKLRLAIPNKAPYVHEGKRYFEPTAIPGCTVAIDEVNQRVVVTPPASQLDTTRLEAAARAHPPLTPASPGAFFNYQLSAQQIDGRSIGGAFTELGLFAGAGVLTNTALARYGDQSQVVRLDTTYTHDFPTSLDTLNIGDAISDGASWGYAQRFAGIRFAKNFGLRPDLLTTPLLATSGTATVPSTVDVFVNNQLVNSSQVPAGPFIVDRLPTVSGTGDVSVVVRDALGREQVLTQSFYSSATLLAQGLSQYSVNIGSIREDYALESNQYGPLLAEGSYRRGLTDAITLEGHAEYLGGQAQNATLSTASALGNSGQTPAAGLNNGSVLGHSGQAHAAGLNTAFALGNFGVANLTVAGGGDSQGSGYLTGAGFEHRGSVVSFVANSLWATRDFVQVGEPVDPDMRMRQRTLAQVGSTLGRFGSASLAYVRESYRDSPAQQTLSLTHSVSFGRAGTLSLTLSQVRTASVLTQPSQSSTSAYLIYVVPIDFRRAVTFSTVGGSGPGAPQNEAIASFTQSPPVGPGSGYRFSASSRGNYDADWHQQFNALDVEAEAARNNGVSGQSLFANGALTFLDGELSANRAVNGSFAMVDVAGLANVPVYVENQLTTHTDANGKALLYNLRPYEANKISIQPEELPLDTTISASSTIMAPPYRSGVVARFPVERVRSGTFRLVLADGQAVPVGATVTLKGVDFPVVHDGMVYVTGYDHGLAAEARWPGGSCHFRLEPPPPDDPQPDMGTVVCQLQGAAEGTTAMSSP